MSRAPPTKVALPCGYVSISLSFPPPPSLLSFFLNINPLINTPIHSFSHSSIHSFVSAPSGPAYCLSHKVYSIHTALPHLNTLRDTRHQRHPIVGSPSSSHDGRDRRTSVHVTSSAHRGVESITEQPTSDIWQTSPSADTHVFESTRTPCAGADDEQSSHISTWLLGCEAVEQPADWDEGKSITTASHRQRQSSSFKRRECEYLSTSYSQCTSSSS
jgi:hypothetical protein